MTDEGLRAFPGAVEIARKLISFPSVTPSDAGAIPYLCDLFRTAGFQAEIVPFETADTARVLNLYARIGKAPPCFAFAGHTDVVPPGDRPAWRFDPFAGEIADGFLWGRGAADMKGGLAACVAAALGFVARAEFHGSIAFLVTGDEEGPRINGTAKLLEWAKTRGERFDHCLLAEPTSASALGDTIKNGRRGSLTGRLRLLGRQGHVAYPQLADNPLRRLARLLDALYVPALDAGTRDFDPSNLEVVSVDVGNAATNVIPAAAAIVFNVRFNDRWDRETVKREIAERLRRALGDDGLQLTFDPTNSNAFVTPKGPFTDLVSRAVNEAIGRTPKLSTSGGTSDAQFIAAYCPVIELGLVGTTMHAVDERVKVADIEALASIFERVLALYFSCAG